jgi:hypothetical protein
MPTPKETYEYCEYLINEELNSLIDTLYKHLENIQVMKTSYLSGR